MTTIAARRRFAKMVHEYLLSIGASYDPSSNAFRAYRLETTLGPLEISEVRAEKRQRFIGIYAAFEDAKRARQSVDCNPYSGKWNHLYETDGYTPEDALESFRMDLEPLLEPRHAATTSAAS